MNKKNLRWRSHQKEKKYKQLRELTKNVDVVLYIIIEILLQYYHLWKYFLDWFQNLFIQIN